MTAVTLFGIFLAPVYAAIARVESEGSDSPNIYQLTRDYIDDVNRITGGRYDEVQQRWIGGKYAFEYDDRFRAPWIAEKAMYIYWEYYGNKCRKNHIYITPTVLADLHRYGYKGMKVYNNSSIESPYCKKFKKYYEEEKKKYGNN